MIDRMEAINMFSEESTLPPYEMYLPGLNDSFWAIRKKILTLLPEERKEELIPVIVNLAKKMPIAKFALQLSRF